MTYLELATDSICHAGLREVILVAEDPASAAETSITSDA